MTGTILPAPFALLNSPLNVGALAIVFSLIIVPLVSVLDSQASQTACGSILCLLRRDNRRAP